MQKVYRSSLFLLAMVANLTIHASTVWVYDETTMVGHVEDEIDKRFQPGLQNEAMKVEIKAFKNEKVRRIAQEVRRAHQNNPFRTQSEAKAYATKVAQEESNQFFKRILRARIAMKMSSFPNVSNVYKDQVVASVNTYLENKAAEEAYATNRLTNSLKKLDENIEDALHDRLDWTCRVCSWLKNR